MTTFPATVMLLGSGELGKEVAIAAQRLGCRVIACDRYAGAPAMQVADLAEVLPMTEAEALLEVVRRHSPVVVIPEIEALAVNALAFRRIPDALFRTPALLHDHHRDIHRLDHCCLWCKQAFLPRHGLGRTIR